MIRRDRLATSRYVVFTVDEGHFFMVEWQGLCDAAAIRPGLPMLLMPKSRILGRPLEKLSAPHDLWILFDQRWARARVEAADEYHLILKIADGERWRLSPREPSEKEPNISSGDMYSEVWVAREKID